jgi:hypothetical protein
VITVRLARDADDGDAAADGPAAGHSVQAGPGIPLWKRN